MSVAGYFEDAARKICDDLDSRLKLAPSSFTGISSEQDTNEFAENKAIRLSKALHASYQLGRRDLNFIRYARCAVTGYSLTQVPDKQEKASLLLLLAWEKQTRYKDCLLSFNSQEYLVAVEKPLPTLIETICDCLIHWWKPYDMRSQGIAIICMHFRD